MIGIVTINEDRSYGAVLQAVGLQQFLAQLGLDNRFVGMTKNLDAVLKLGFRTPKEAVKSAFTIVHYRQLKRGCERFEQFVAQHEKCFPRYESYDALAADPPVVSGYVVGSDQVWPETNLLPVFGLSFAQNGIKVSYAASMGKDIISEDKQAFFREYLKNFNTISVREKTAVSAISEVYDGQVQYHIDPSLLHDRTFWDQYAEKYEGSLPEKYILLFMIYVPPRFNEMVERIKRETGLPVVLLSNTPYKNIRCDYCIRDAGPAEFLWLIDHAEGVVSSSFHGVAFSIIYEKPFTAVINPASRCRLDNLLALLHLEDRDIWDASFLQKKHDWSHVHDVLQAERSRSRSYLRGAFGKCHVD